MKEKWVTKDKFGNLKWWSDKPTYNKWGSGRWECWGSDGYVPPIRLVYSMENPMELYRDLPRGEILELDYEEVEDKSSSVTQKDSSSCGKVEREIVVLPESAEARKTYPIWEGAIKYFPNALALVAHQSWLGNQQHHPDDPLWWDMSKSSDELDALMRHGMEGDWVAVAWRALANLEREVQKGYRPFEREGEV